MLTEQAAAVLAKMGGQEVLVEGECWVETHFKGDATRGMPSQVFEAIVSASCAVASGEDIAWPEPRKKSGLYAGRDGRMRIYADRTVPPGEIQLRDDDGRVLGRFTLPRSAAPERGDAT